MPLQGVLLLFFIIIVLPLVIFFEDPNFFFLLIAIVLFAASLRSIYAQVFPGAEEEDASEEGMLEEMEESLHINMKKFSLGIGVAKNLIILLFLGYCTFFLQHFYIKVFAAAIMAFWGIETLRLLFPPKQESASPWASKFRELFVLLMDLSMVVFIIFVFINKYMGRVL